MNTTTTNLEDFGYRELALLVKLLKALQEQSLPKNMSNEKLTPMMNKNSGNVFLTNSDFEVAMMNEDKLEMFYSCGECGFEGFAQTLLEQGNICCKECLE